MSSLLSRFSSKREQAPDASDMPTNFISWPANEKGHPLQSLKVALPLEEALNALFGPQAVVGVSFSTDIPKNAVMTNALRIRILECRQ